MRLKAHTKGGQEKKFYKLLLLTDEAMSWEFLQLKNKQKKLQNCL